MLIACPECDRQVSDRATSCPGCGFPIAEHVASQAAEAGRQAERASRQHVGEVDCATCDARGFKMFTQADEQGREREVFRWCSICEHSGRVPLCQSTQGYFAVSYARLERFLKGEVDEDGDEVRALGSERPTGHAYPEAGPRKPQE